VIISESATIHFIKAQKVQIGMKRIPKVEDYMFYLDVAASKAKKRAEEVKSGYSGIGKGKLNLFHFKEIELARITVFGDVLKEKLREIITSFPNFEQLQPFYLELVKSTIDYREAKRSLASLQWAIENIDKFQDSALHNIKKSREVPTVSTHRRHAYGRIMSIVKQVRDKFQHLDECRRVFVDYPSVKEMFTVCIAGFPNVGKSTLLSQLTPAKPEIANYAFTTKSLNLGYLMLNHQKVQIMDTPGTLNRFEVMNAVEKQAHLALHYVANVIVYVFDLTVEATASLENQKKLFLRIKRYGKPIIVYFSKQDLLQPGQVMEFAKSYEDICLSPDHLKEMVKKHIPRDRRLEVR
jgi:nucleolar GTP-binding protein